ncbi:MAG: hypothetical protein R3C49_00225 [Planctomycetaceae bacterium]
MKAPSVSETRWLVAIVLCGTALRIVMLLFQAGELNADPDGYVGYATVLKTTGTFSSPWSTQPSAFRPPLYPMVLAALLWIGMPTAFAVGLINILGTASLTATAWWLVRKLGLVGVWPALAAAIVAIDPLMMKYSTQPMTEVCSATLLSLAILHFLEAIPGHLESAGSSDEVADEPPGNSERTVSVRECFKSGLYFGLAALCRPVALITCAVVCGSVIVFGACGIPVARPDRTTPVQRRRSRIRLRAGLMTAIVAAVVVSPWIIRNAVQFHAFIPATTHGGYTLLLGNNEAFYREVVNAPGQPVWSGPGLSAWQTAMNQEMQNSGVTPGSEVETDVWMYQKAVDSIRHEPDLFLKAVVLRWKRFWALTPSRDDGERSVIVSSVVGIWYLVLWIGIFSSLPACFVRRSADVQMLWLAVLSFLLLHSFYWTNTRMRAPLMGVLCVLAVYGWQFVLSLKRSTAEPKEFSS